MAHHTHQRIIRRQIKRISNQFAIVDRKSDRVIKLAMRWRENRDYGAVNDFLHTATNYDDILNNHSDCMTASLKIMMKDIARDQLGRIGK
jgi:hypothetical protein